MSDIRSESAASDLSAPRPAVSLVKIQAVRSRRPRGWWASMRRMVRYRLVIPVFRSAQSPEFTARGVANGVFWGLTPTVGLQTLEILGTWFVARPARPGFESAAGDDLGLGQQPGHDDPDVLRVLSDGPVAGRAAAVRARDTARSSTSSPPTRSSRGGRVSSASSAPSACRSSSGACRTRSSAPPLSYRWAVGVVRRRSRPPLRVARSTP